MKTYLILLDESDEVGSIDLDRMAELVLQRDDEVEEVALPQVRRRLLRERGSAGSNKGWR